MASDGSLIGVRLDLPPCKGIFRYDSSRFFWQVRISNAATEAFLRFRSEFDKLGVKQVRAVATSAVREANNGQQLVERIAREAGLQLEVITGSEEARRVHRAVSSRIDLTGGQWILVDLGGGSVEVSLADDAGMLWWLEAVQDREGAWVPPTGK